MANYGFARKVTLTNLETGKQETIVSTPGDYLRARRWMGENLKGHSDEEKSFYGDYAWAWFAAEHAGAGEPFGMKGRPTIEGIDAAMDVCAIDFERLEDGSVPLPKSSPAK